MVRNESEVRFMSKSNCNFKYIQKTLLTEQKFKETLDKFGVRNPLVKLIVKNDFERFCKELCFLSDLIKSVGPVQNLEEVLRALLRTEEDYKHTRLQLKIASRIQQNPDCEVLSLEPEPNKINKKPDILAKIRDNTIAIEIATKQILGRELAYLRIPEEIRKFIKEQDISKPIQIKVEPKFYPNIGQSQSALKEVFSKIKGGQLSIKIKKGPIEIAIEESKYDGNLVIAGGIKAGEQFGSIKLFPFIIGSMVQKKNKQLPQNSDGIIVIDITNMGSLRTQFAHYDALEPGLKEKLLPNLDKEHYENLMGALIYDTSELGALSIETDYILHLPNPHYKMAHIDIEQLVSLLQGHWNKKLNNRDDCKEIFEKLRKHVSHISYKEEIRDYTSVISYEK